MSGDLLIYAARVVMRDRVVDPGWVYVSGSRIAAVGDGAPPPGLLQATAVRRINAGRQWLVPGFIDMHVHGGDGVEVMDGTPAAIRRIARFHASHGTTGWLPTTLTAPPDAIERSLRAVRQVQDETLEGAAILGVHLEGPFISPRKLGAQNPQYVAAPTREAVRRLVEAVPGLVRKITLAPECEGALAAIEMLRRQGIIVSIGHSDASSSETQAAIAAGARHATHLFNAMRGLHHRDGGVVGACLLADGVVCELIADGFHVDFDVIRLVVQIKGSDRIALITDAMAATGCSPGRYRLGELDVWVEDGRAVLLDGHTLAGSVLTMERAVANMIDKAHVAVPDAVAMASAVPARELGLADRKGTIAPMFDADLVLLDEAWSVTRTFIAGREVYCRSD